MEPEGEVNPVRYLPRNTLAECESCNGSGWVTVLDYITTDARTEWQQRTEYYCNVECPDCDGTGKQEVDAGVE